MTTHWPDITGADRGFNVESDVLSSTIDGVNLNQLWSELVDAQKIWNSTKSNVSSLFTFNTTAIGDSIEPTGSASDFEIQSEFGEPKSIRPNLQKLDIGYDFEWWDTAVRYTRRFLLNSSAEQVRAVHQSALNADDQLLFREIMRAISTPLITSGRPTNPEGIGLYSVFAGTGDVKPPTYLGHEFSTSHSHFLVSGAATVDGGDLRDLIKTIQEHGYGIPGSGERVVIFVHPDQGELIRGLRVADGDPFDFIPSSNAPAFLTSETVQGATPPDEYNGLAIFGSYGDAWLTESYLIPTGYVFALSTGGNGSERNPLGFREHPQAGSRGLVIVPGTERFPLVGAAYMRGFGLGVRNRGAAAVMQIKASGNYQAPTF